MKRPLSKGMRTAIIGLASMCMLFGLALGLAIGLGHPAQAQEAPQMVRVGTKVPDEFLLNRHTLAGVIEAATKSNEFVMCSMSPGSVWFHDGELYVWDGPGTTVELGETLSVPVEVGPKGELQLYIRRSRPTVWYRDQSYNPLQKKAMKVTQIIVVEDGRK